ncbi:hypothetical protein BECAL_03027 [Bellilinea caldifistulae]|nr:hypothetical protein BECAL_03027 [Bellilinea caldifistulae]
MDVILDQYNTQIINPQIDFVALRILGIILSIVPTAPLLCMLTEVDLFLKPVLSIWDQIQRYRMRGMVIDDDRPDESLVRIFLGKNSPWFSSVNHPDILHRLSDSQHSFDLMISFVYGLPAVNPQRPILPLHSLAEYFPSKGLVTQHPILKCLFRIFAFFQYIPDP